MVTGVSCVDSVPRPHEPGPPALGAAGGNPHQQLRSRTPKTCGLGPRALGPPPPESSGPSEAGRPHLRPEPSRNPVGPARSPLRTDSMPLSELVSAWHDGIDGASGVPATRMPRPCRAAPPSDTGTGLRSPGPGVIAGAPVAVCGEEAGAV